MVSQRRVYFTIQKLNIAYTAIRPILSLPLTYVFDYSTYYNTITMASRHVRDAEDDLIDNALLSLMLQLIPNAPEPPKTRQSRRISREEGKQRLTNLLESNHDGRIQAALRMSRDTFYQLRNWLTKHANLKASKHISVEMKLAIFIFITTRPASQRDTIEQYGLGNRAISE
jgi:hypothetical protein